MAPGGDAVQIKAARLALVVALALLIGMIFAEDTAHAKNRVHYVDAVGGSDLNRGVSPGRAWATIKRANRLDLDPGDRLLFKGGQTFVGNLKLRAEDAGTAKNPIRIGSYGTGRAKIDAGAGSGFKAYNAGGVAVSNLIVTGVGRANGNRGSGILFYTDLGDAKKLRYIRVRNVEASGFGYSGVEIGAAPKDGSKSGFSDVRITDVVSHDNADAGIQTYGSFSSSAKGWAHRNIYVGHSETFDNRGIPDKGNNSGNGIVLGDVNGATIERCVSHHNGENNEHLGGGPIGIWAWDSNRVTIQHNESYANQTSTLDGGGFDLDGGVTNSVMQYNYSHDNAGAGYLLAQFAYARPFSNNVVRYNTSENDGRKNSYGAIHFWNGNGSSGIENTEVYGNTVYVSPQDGANPAAVRFDTPTTNTHLRNNIFMTTGGVPLVSAVSGQPGLLFQGNDYWSSADAFRIWHGGTMYGGLDAWRRATGQEISDTSETGYNVDPKLTSSGGGGTVGNADRLASLAAYRLRADSPMIDAGLNLKGLFGLDAGLSDFYGGSVPQGKGHDIGAHEAVPMTVAQGD